MARQRMEKWPTLAYRILFFRSARAPDSHRSDTPIMRSDCEKGQAAGGRAEPVFWNLRLAPGKRASGRGSGRREPHAFFGKFGIVSGMDIVNHRDTVPFTTADGSTIRELLAHRNSAICQQSLAEARRHIEIHEFLFEVVARSRMLASAMHNERL